MFAASCDVPQALTIPKSHNPATTNIRFMGISFIQNGLVENAIEPVHRPPNGAALACVFSPGYLLNVA